MLAKRTDAITTATQAITERKPNATMQTWINRKHSEVDWISNGAVLLYQHNDNDFFLFCEHKLPALKAKNVKRVYVEFPPLELADLHKFAKNESIIERLPDAQRDSLKAKVAFLKAATKYNIELVSAFPESIKRSGMEQGPDVWFMNRIIKTDPQATENIVKLHQSSSGPIIACFGPMHASIATKLNLPAFCIGTATTFPPADFSGPKDQFQPCPSSFFAKKAGFYDPRLSLQDPAARQPITQYLDTLTSHFLILNITKDQSKTSLAKVGGITVALLIAILAIMYMLTPKGAVSDSVPKLMP